MKKINILIAIIILSLTSYLCAMTAGIPITLLVDLISFLFVVVPSYLYTSANYNSYNFFNNKDAVRIFGNSAMGFAYLGAVIGLIFAFGNVGSPAPPTVEPIAAWSTNFAVAMISILYGLIVKYVVCGAFINN